MIKKLPLHSHSRTPALVRVAWTTLHPHRSHRSMEQADDEFVWCTIAKNSKFRHDLMVKKMGNFLIV